MAGAKPKPTQLKIIAGNPGRRPLNTREPKPEGDLVEPPSSLTERQREIWRQAIANAPRGLLKQIDGSVLKTWVVAYDFHEQAAEKVATFGLLTKTPKTGDWMQNPYLAIVNKQAIIMMRAAAEMGFTPSSRSRVTVDPAGGEGDEWAGF